MARWTPRRIAATVIVTVAAALALWWWLQRPPDRARSIAEQVVSPRQRQLWLDVNDRGTPDGVARLPARTPPAPQPSLAPSQPIAPVNAGLAPGTTTGTRLLATSNEPDWQYSGRARVT